MKPDAGRVRDDESHAPDLRIERTSAVTARVNGRDALWFAGCDYLGLAHHPDVIAALVTEARAHGVSASASPTTTGTSPAHVELETRLARFLGVEAALLVADGYLSNLVALQSFDDTLASALVDRRSHVSVRDALRATNVPEREYDTAAEARVLLAEGALRPCVLVTDGLFPAAKHIAPLDALVPLLDVGLEALVVDDCHGLGVLGAHGRGTCEHFGVAHERLVITGTLSKCLGAFGGFVAGSRARIASAREHAIAWSGATPIPPAIARAGIAALDVLEREPERRARLRSNIARLRAAFGRLGLPVSSFDNPVATVSLPSAAAMQRAHAALLDAGLLVPFVHYPDGLGGYLRIALSAEHRPEHMAALEAGVTRVLRG
ncbi:MAG: pyridoxal phosphate-dependent aminotransferase family protein [Planctomycetes bacterium]|nr:pyridoxal phosphate-dependent aminotransferase family protein [Planctomycetota bacterium]